MCKERRMRDDDRTSRECVSDETKHEDNTDCIFDLTMHLDTDMFVVLSLIYGHPRVDISVGCPATLLVATLQHKHYMLIRSWKLVAQLRLQRVSHCLSDSESGVVQEGYTDGDIHHARGIRACVGT